MNIEIRKIDLKDWEFASERKNSKTYLSADKKWILKIPSIDNQHRLEELKKEFDIINSVRNLGISTPMAKEIIMFDDGQYGIVYEYINNKKSYGSIINEHPEMEKEIIELYVKHAKKLHSIDAKNSNISSIEERVKDGLDNSKIFNEKEKDIIFNNMSKLPKRTTCLQGDFQPSNIIMSGDKTYFIDLSLFSYGNPLYDLGILWFIVTYSNNRVFERIFHSSQENAKRRFELFLKLYFGIDDVKDIIKVIIPYGLVSVNIMLKIMPNVSFVVNAKEEILRGNI